MSDQKDRPTSGKLWGHQLIESYRKRARHTRRVAARPGIDLAKLVADILDDLENRVIGRLEQALVAKLDALLATGFTPQRVFHAARWAQLQPQFRRYQEELGEVSFGEAWGSLARPALLDALHEMPEELQAVERYNLVRRKVQHNVERYLMDGLTTDSKREESLELLSEPDLPDEADICPATGRLTHHAQTLVIRGQSYRQCNHRRSWAYPSVNPRTHTNSFLKARRTRTGGKHQPDYGW